MENVIALAVLASTRAAARPPWRASACPASAIPAVLTAVGPGDHCALHRLRQRLRLWHADG